MDEMVYLIIYEGRRHYVLIIYANPALGCMRCDRRLGERRETNTWHDCLKWPPHTHKKASVELYYERRSPTMDYLKLRYAVHDKAGSPPGRCKM